MSCHVVSCHVMSCRVVPCGVVSCHVVTCRVRSCHVTLGFVIICFDVGNDMVFPVEVTCQQAPILRRPAILVVTFQSKHKYRLCCQDGIGSAW